MLSSQHQVQGAVMVEIAHGVGFMKERRKRDLSGIGVADRIAMIDQLGFRGPFTQVRPQGMKAASPGYAGCREPHVLADENVSGAGR